MESKGIIQDHDIIIAIATNRLSATKQKISELEKENESIIYNYYIIVVTATYCISSAEKKIEELEQKARKRQRANEDKLAIRGYKRKALVEIGGDLV